MKVRKKYSLVFVSLMAGLLLLLSACGTTGTGATSNLSPAEVLQKSIDAMKSVKSAHMELQSTDSAQASQGGSGGSSVMVSLKGKGDEALPDEQFSLTASPTNVTIAEIVKGDKVYVQNTQGKWYVLDKSVFDNAAGTSNPFAGFSFNESDLLGLLANVQIVDHGDETLNGIGVRHITASLDKAGLKQILASYPQAKTLLAGANIDAILNSTKSFQSSIDVWIDNTKFYLNRTELKVNLTTDASALTATATPTSSSATATPTIATVKVDSIIDLSKFDQPVTITPPSDATPTSDPSVIFGA